MIIPQLGVEAVMKSIKQAEFMQSTELDGKKQVALDHYYHDPIQVSEHIRRLFKKEVHKQVPEYPQKIVPRFARARMMLYKKPPERILKKEKYFDYCYQLDSKMREFAEVAWLLKDCLLYSFYNKRKKRLEYKIIPIFQEYYLKDDQNNVWGYSYEINKDEKGNRRFAFWSETRDGEAGLHFVFKSDGKIEDDPSNPQRLNPYKILPFTKASNTHGAFDVVDTAIQLGIGMTQIALGARFNLGTLWTNGKFSQKNPIKWGLDSAIQIPQDSTLGTIGIAGSLLDNIEAVKAFANMTAENNHLRIRWGESGGNPPSGESLRILEIENLDARESDIPLWVEIEKERFKVDSTILDIEGKGKFEGDYQVNFKEIQFPQTEKEIQEIWDWRFQNGYDLEDYFREVNPDMPEEEIKRRIEKVNGKKGTDILNALQSE